MATIFYLPAGLIPNDTGLTSAASSVSYMAAGGIPNDIIPPLTGTGSITLTEISLSASGTVKHIGTGSITLTEISLSASGTVKHIGTGSITLTEISTSAIGTRSGPPNVVGTGSITLSNVSACGVLETVDLVVSADFTECLEPEYFHYQANTVYNNDRDLYDNLLAEGNNIHGTTCTYYMVTWDTNFDPIFGEDDDRHIERKFPVKGVFELPKEMEQIGQFGIEGLDNFQIFVSQKHFSEVSQFDVSGAAVGFFPTMSDCDPRSTRYTSASPKVGDILRSNYNNKYYEVLDVGQEQEMFLQKKHSWVLTVRTLIFNNLSVSATTSAAMDMITSAITDKPDILKHNEIITSADDNVLYNPSSTEEDTNQDPLGGW